MAFFRQPSASMTLRQTYEAKYNAARINLLLAVILTTVNIVFLLTRDFSYFLFSASIPYMLVDFGMVLCGKYPPEYYEGEIADMAFFGDGLLITLSVIAFLIVGVYLALWYFSRRHKNCLTAALILFIIDTVLLLALLNPSLSGLLDLLFHGLVIYELTVGLRAANVLKNLPPEDVTDVPYTDADENVGAEATAEADADTTLMEQVLSDTEPPTSTEDTEATADNDTTTSNTDTEA